MSATGTRIGVEGLNAYCGLARISVRTFFERRGLDDSRFDNLMMDQRSVQLPWEDSVTNAVNAAKPLVDALDPADRDRIELLVTSTESGLDYSKAIASYVHNYLGLSRQCRTMEVKQACYGATGALQLAAGYLAAGIDPEAEAKALIIATDVNPMDEHARYAEPTTGHGAVAILLGNQPAILTLDAGAYGLNSFEAMDTARPAPDLDLYDTDLSLLTYLESLSACYREYTRRVPEASFSDWFDYFVMHTPFAGMVRAAHRKLMREVARSTPQAIEEDFGRRISPSLAYPRLVGNLCSGSVWLALASLIDSETDETEHARVGLYSYGSGCAAEFFSGVIAPGASAVLAKLDIGGRLRRRREMPFEEYERLLPEIRSCLVPRRDRTVDRAGLDAYLEPFRADGPLLMLKSVRNYHRQYEWTA